MGRQYVCDTCFGIAIVKRTVKVLGIRGSRTAKRWYCAEHDPESTAKVAPTIVNADDF
jgi:hypothetical protein